MEDKLQEKFALVQQMKREKELKEARAKETQPFDIFTLAGVTLPASGTAGGLNMTIRHDSGSSSGPTVGTVKRPRKERTTSTSEVTGKEAATAGSRTADETSTTGPSVSATGEKKLKRSSMAVRMDNAEGDESRARAGAAEGTGSTSDASAGPSHGRQPSTVSTVSASLESPTTATPPTPIPSPKNEEERARGSKESSPVKPELARDMTHNVQSRSGSIDDDEEMVIDMFGRSVPRSRHHSSDEGSDSENEIAHPRRRRRTRHEEDDHHHHGSYHRSGRYGSRSRSRSRSRSHSPARRSRRSRSRSVSPYYPHVRGGDRRRRRGSDREHRDHSGDEARRGPAEEVDPYQAASRYLDTAFYPTKIYVGNLPSSISLTSLRTVFAPFGDIEDMNLVEGKDFGFVTYVEPLGAQQALAKMNGAMLEGTYIRVNRAKIPERNRRGFAGVAWMDEDGELARMEEEQHQQAAAIAGGFLASAPPSASSSRPDSGSSSREHGHHRRGSHGHGHGHKRSNGGMATTASSSSSSAVSPAMSNSSSMSGTYQAAPSRGPTHQLPTRPRSPKLPPKPTGAASFPPAGLDPRAAMASRGGGRQILRYDDL